MAIINASTTRPQSLVRRGRNDYTPTKIGSWVAVDERDYPWNTIGSALEHSSGKGRKVSHLLTAAEAMDATGLDITVIKQPVVDQSTGLVIPQVFVTCYDDPERDCRQYLGAVSDKYEVVQPRAALSFFDQVVSECGGAHYSAVWNMYEKSMMGVTIELPFHVVIDPKGADDHVVAHLLGGNSFDGSTGLSGVVDTTRLWCMNQITPRLTINGAVTNRFSLRHTKNVLGRVDDAKAMLGMVNAYASWLDGFANGLHAKRMSDGQFTGMISKLAPFALDGTETDLVKARVEERREHLLESWRAPHNANITGTRWGALNVVAEWAEWGRAVKGSPRTGTSVERQRAIGTLVHPNVTGIVNLAANLLAA